jgi:hypothetical protein
MRHVVPGVARPEPVLLSASEARAFLVGHCGLRRPEPKSGPEGVRSALKRLRSIQLDPLDVIGTNADLAALARVDGLSRGDVFRAVYPGHAFEHFAKERCLLPASAFPWYRGQAAETPWWRLAERLKRLPPGLVEEVLEEIRARGPVTPDDLTDRGKVEPLDWSGWKGTGRAVVMAIEVLWTRCEVVVCGRTERGMLYDIPERVFPGVEPKPASVFGRWAIVERVEAAGLLARAGGAIWSMLDAVRGSKLPEQLVEEGILESVCIEGSGRPYLAPAGFRERAHPPADGRVRILGPLDALLWDRGLVKRAFGFDYAWEVYKPAGERRWGWYVTPLLRGDALVGRMEAAVERGALRVKKLWREEGAAWDDAALDEALARHARACGVEKVVRPRSRSR